MKAFIINLLLLNSFTPAYSAGINFQSHVSTILKYEVEVAANEAYPGAQLVWSTLKCVDSQSKVGTCLVSGDLSAPNSATVFIVNVYYPDYRNGNYSDHAVKVLAATGES